jgi:lysophospholipid acyltransferase (LPLAT)-like uncharacterized protein
MSADTSIYTISGWRRAVLWPLALLARAWGASLRFEVSAAERTLLAKRDEPVAFVLWHNRLFITPEIHRRYRHGRPLCALISASRDGAWLAAFFSLVGIQAVRGSSSRLGRPAAAGLIDALRAGHDAGITPDGPRGPCYEFKPGAAAVTRATATPMLLLGCRYYSAWRLGSWDRFYLPRPFSRVRLRCALVPPDPAAEPDATAPQLAARLRELSPD